MIRDIEVKADGSGSLGARELRPGDADNDNDVDYDDFNNYLVPSFGTVEGDPAYLWQADFNRDKQINIKDFGLLTYSFGLEGEDEAENIQTLSKVQPLGNWQLGQSAEIELQTQRADLVNITLYRLSSITEERTAEAIIRRRKAIRKGENKIRYRIPYNISPGENYFIEVRSLLKYSSAIFDDSPLFAIEQG